MQYFDPFLTTASCWGSWCLPMSWRTACGRKSTTAW